MTTQIQAKIKGGQAPAKTNLRNLEKVRAIFGSMSKYISAKAIYSSNNPNVGKFANAFHDAFRAFFADEKELLLTVEQYQLKWRDEVVYDNSQKTDSIAFLLYKDGVGEIIFQSSVKPPELEQFLDVIKNEIYNPSAHLDIVSRLWQSQFTDISYRVFDEFAAGESGEGRGSESESRELPLRANDHPNLPSVPENDESNTAQCGISSDSLGSYLYRIIEQNHPGADAYQTEQHVQHMLESFFIVNTEELTSWQDEFSTAYHKDKLLWLLDTMLDFTKARGSPAAVRDILDVIEHLMCYITEEAHIPTLIALLDIQRTLVHDPAIAPDFQFLPAHFDHELTNSAFLLSLGKKANRSHDDVHDVLQYFRMVGKDAVPGVCKLLANLKDPSMHNEACDALIEIAGDDIMRVINDLNLDNPFEAEDAVYLLRHCATSEVPPIAKRLACSPDVHVREQVIEYLARIGNDEAAQLLCKLLEDGDMNVRAKTLVGVEELRHPLIIDRVTALCFAEDHAARSVDELERLFRAVGKLAGENVLAQIKHMLKTRSWLPFGNARDKQNKLLAITALRQIGGRESVNMLTKLAADGDSLVRNKALYVLKQLGATGGVSGGSPTSAVDKQAK